MPGGYPAAPSVFRPPSAPAKRGPAAGIGKAVGAYGAGAMTGKPAAGSGGGAASIVGGADPHAPNTPAPSTPAAPEAAPQGGTQSGPGILENWFNQRANGTDPGWEYGMGRASDSINRQFAARGGYNSSGAMQSLSDMYANANSQREGQLDALAGGASGEHQRRLEDMFNQGQGLANGQANTAQGYDFAGGGAMANGMRTKMDLFLNRSGVDQKTRQGQLNAITNIGSTAASLLGGGGGMKPPGGGGGGGGAQYPTGDEIFRPY